MEKLRRVIEDTDTRAGRTFDIIIQILIVASLITFSIGTIPDLSDSTIKFLRYFQVFTVSIFTIEYILRIVVAKRKLSYIFSFYGLIDIVAILPFYLSFGLDLRSLRVLRMFRVFRLIKLVRYSKALKRYERALKIASEELTIFLFGVLMLFFLAGAGIYFFENPVQPEVFTSIFSSLWWAVITLTTVGYGDIYPITVGGKIFTFFLLIIGLGIIAVPSGILASSLSKVREDELNDIEE
jgi:voltage-gated potassium channel